MIMNQPATIDHQDFLIEKIGDSTRLIPWEKVSPVAANLADEFYEPSIWWQNKTFAESLEKTSKSA